jgi:hypothetical protein
MARSVKLISLVCYWFDEIDCKNDKTSNIQIDMVDDSPFHLIGTFIGPDDTPYAGGKFQVVSLFQVLSLFFGFSGQEIVFILYLFQFFFILAVTRANI